MMRGGMHQADIATIASGSKIGGFSFLTRNTLARIASNNTAKHSSTFDKQSKRRDVGHCLNPNEQCTRDIFVFYGRKYGCVGNILAG